MKKMKKVFAGLLAATMVMSMSVTALADETTYADMSTVTVTKTYKVTNGGTSPAETFTFSRLTCTGVTDAADGVNKENAPVPTIGSVEYAAGEAGSDKATKEITINLPDYDSVGIYTYTFTENDGETAGVTYYSDEITLKVTVIEQGGKVRVAAVHTEDAGEVKTSEFDNVYSAGELAVTKTVTGLLGDKTKDFTVTVKFTAPAGDTVREAITYTDGTETKTIAAGWSTTEEAEITLKNGETVTFENIPYGVTYVVEENDYTGDGYDEAVYSYDDTEKKIDSAKDSVEIVNNKDGNVDTGISLDNMPYIMVLALVALGLVGFVSKKRSMEF